MNEKIATLERLEKSMKTDPTTMLPPEIILLILQFMDYKDLLSLKQISRSYYNLIKDQNLWYKLYLRKYPWKNSMDYSRSEEYFYTQHHVDNNWNTLKYKVHTTKIHSRGIYCVDICDNLIVCGGRDQTVKMFDLQGKLLAEMRGHTASVLCVQLVSGADIPEHSSIPSHLYPMSLRNRIVSGSSDASVSIWDTSNATLLVKFPAHSEAVLNVSVFDNFHTFATCSKDRHVRLWDINNLQTPLLSMDGHQAAVNSVVALKDLIVSAGGDRVIKVWDKRNGTVCMTLQGHDRGIACLDVDEHYIASGSSDKTIRIHDLRMGTCFNVIRAHDELVRTVCINSRRNIIVSGSYDCKVIASHFKESTTSQILEPPKQPYPVLEYSNDRKQLQQTLEMGLGHSSRVFNVAMSNERIVSVAEDNRIIFWNFNQ